MLAYRERAGRGAVECVWLVSGESPDRAPERIVPDGCPEVIVHLGDPFARRVDGRWRRQPICFLAGTLGRPWTLRPGRRVSTVGIRLSAGEAAAFLGASLAGTADREVPLATIVGAGPARALVRALRAASSTDARLAAALAWAGARSPDAGRAAARPAVALIRRARGALRMGELAARLGWPRRRLERVFLHDLGISAKLYARIVRLNAVLAALAAPERAAAVDIALAAGYFDQAHLLRDFRELAGRLPRGSDGELARHFTRPERLRLLLEGE